jgi:hypothetical protein
MQNNTNSYLLRSGDKAMEMSFPVGETRRKFCPREWFGDLARAPSAVMAACSNRFAKAPSRQF